MSQILDDLKTGFKKVDEFYSNKVREPVVSFIKSCGKFIKDVPVQKLAKVFKNIGDHLDKSNAHVEESIFEERSLNEDIINTSNQVSSMEDFEKYDASVNDTAIM